MKMRGKSKKGPEFGWVETRMDSRTNRKRIRRQIN